MTHENTYRDDTLYVFWSQERIQRVMIQLSLFFDFVLQKEKKKKKKNFDDVRNWNYLKFNTYAVGKQTHDLTVTASDSKTTQSGGDNRKKNPTRCRFTSPAKIFIHAVV